MITKPLTPAQVAEHRDKMFEVQVSNLIELINSEMMFGHSKLNTEKFDDHVIIKAREILERSGWDTVGGCKGSICFLRWKAKGSDVY